MGLVTSCTVYLIFPKFAMVKVYSSRGGCQASPTCVEEMFPDASPQPRPGMSVICVDAESVPQILNERARLWQMDTSRLYLMRPEDKLYIDFGDPADRDHLVEMALHLEPALIVIDSLGSISSKGENNVEDVRDLLGFLNRRR